MRTGILCTHHLVDFAEEVALLVELRHDAGIVSREPLDGKVLARLLAFH